MTTARAAVVVASLLAAASVAACARAPEREVEASTAPVPSLPDLTKLAPSVQAQLGGRHARLVTLASERAPAAVQGAAAGELGMLLLAAQFPEAPEAWLLRARALDPTTYRWPYFLAQFYRQHGQLDAALAQFERAAHLQPTDVASHVWIGDIELQLGHPEAAAPHFSAALTLQPTSLSARFGLGRSALAQRDDRAAIAHFEAVLAQDPSAAAVHYPLSQAYAAVGDAAQAARHLAQRASHEILPADPLMVELETVLDSPQSYETRGIRALEANDGTAAAAAFRQGLVLAPDTAALHHRLGAALGMLGDRDAARREYETAVRLAPDQFLASYSLGLLEQEDGYHDRAIVRFAAALTARPSYVQARLRLAASLRRLHRPAEALAEYRRALTDDADLAEASIGCAMTLVQLRRHREARALLEDAARRAPASVAFAHGLARLLATAPEARVRDGARARQIVEDLVAQGRTLDLGETMAMALAELGEYPRAVAVQRDLITAATRAGLTSAAARMAQNLSRYERRQPCRVPWTEQEWP